MSPPFSSFITSFQAIIQNRIVRILADVPTFIDVTLTCMETTIRKRDSAES
jgi:hypothetical protein